MEGDRLRTDPSVGWIDELESLAPNICGSLCTAKYNKAELLEALDDLGAAERIDTLAGILGKKPTWEESAEFTAAIDGSAAWGMRKRRLVLKATSEPSAREVYVREAVFFERKAAVGMLFPSGELEEEGGQRHAAQEDRGQDCADHHSVFVSCCGVSSAVYCAGEAAFEVWGRETTLDSPRKGQGLQSHDCLDVCDIRSSVSM